MRKLNHLALDVSYRSLGRLRLEQGDLASAAALLDRAVELSAQPQGWIPTWDIYHYRGRVRMAQGRLRDALADLRIAVRLARELAVECTARQCLADGDRRLAGTGPFGTG